MSVFNHETPDRAPAARWQPMKTEHLTFLASEQWAQMLQRDLLPWLLADNSLGDDVLEIGPGPGLTTELLSTLAPSVTAVELDGSLAAQLSERLAGTRVEVVHADAARLSFADGRFSAVACFHMLHHVPSAAEQDAVFAEVARVLKPGGVFLCVDALDIEILRTAHREQGETFVPLDPAHLHTRLTSFGFRRVEVRVADYQVLVRALR
jgi:ubiquinone/menaquinone biosynthesis C-methylase UbiE